MMDLYDPIAAKMNLREQIRSMVVNPPTSIPPLYTQEPIQQFRPAEPLERPYTRLDEKLAFNETPEGQHAQYAEVRRICELPVLFPMTPEEITEYTRLNVLAEAFNNPMMARPGSGDPGFRLMKEQAEGLYAYELVNGGFFSIGVGKGKTLLGLMIAHKAFLRGLRRVLLQVPSNVYGQLTVSDIRWARMRVPMNYPIMEMGDKPMETRRKIAKSKNWGLYILPHSMLSTKDAEENIYEISPELIITDECHELANPTAARTQRVGRYLRSNNPQTVWMSGTITHKAMREYAHQIRASLGTGCPIPISKALQEEWGNVIDAHASSDGTDEPVTGGTGPLVPLLRWSQRTFPTLQISEDVAGFRLAYRLRLGHTRGVVASGDAEIGTSLVISNRKCEADPKAPDQIKLKEFVDKVELEWRTPNDDNIEHAIHKWKWLYELSAGFYNLLLWPSDDTLARRRGVPLAEAKAIMDRAREHHAAAQEYAKALRAFLRDMSSPSLDTPLLVGNNIYRNHAAGNAAKDVPQDLANAWVCKERLDFAGRPDREPEAVRVSDFKIRAAVQWAMDLPRDKGALIWVWHQEMGRWVYEALCNAGVNALHCPAGPQHNAAILDPANSQKKIVASISSHGQGKNLQHFSENLVVQWPRSAADAEQMLGRTHRTGQAADSLVVASLNTTLHDDLNFAACLNDALYTHQTMGNQQKMVYCGYDPTPTIFPSAVLYQRGLEVHILNAMQQAQMMDRFGVNQ